ncbi:MAG: O-antigen ligase family protein [Flavobacteriaceae bacterium]|nr:O-antigen ligase family protein [Flavobacteriaceae bacterium]
MNLIKNVFKEIEIVFFYISVFTLTQSIKTSSKLLFVALVIGLLKSIFTRDFSWYYNHKKTINIFIVFFTYICFQGIFIDGIDNFFKTFERGYAPYIIFIFIPLFFKKESVIELLPKVFIAGLLFTTLLIIIYSVYENQIYDRNNVLQTFKIHHLYFSLYLLFSVNYLLSHFEKNTSLKVKTITVGITLLFMMFLFFFKSKAAIFILALITSYYLIIKLKWNKLKIISLSLSVVVLLFIFNKYFLNIYLRAIDFRSTIWLETIKIINENPLFGYGTLNEHLMLNKNHFLSGSYDFLDSNYNSHNQYLTFLIKFGFIGLSLIVTTYISPLFKLKDKLKKEYCIFLIIVGFMALIESIYNRHHGIVFCTIFLYYYSSLSKFKIKES